MRRPAGWAGLIGRGPARQVSTGCWPQNAAFGAGMKASVRGLGLALDLDPPGAGLGRLRQADGENAVRQFGVDLVRIGVGGCR
jgi:hypothetical protein